MPHGNACSGRGRLGGAVGWSRHSFTPFCIIKSTVTGSLQGHLITIIRRTLCLSVAVPQMATKARLGSARAIGDGRNRLARHRLLRCFRGNSISDGTCHVT